MGFRSTTVKQINRLRETERVVALGAYNAETLAWVSGILTLGGSPTTQEINWADALIVAIRAATYGTKIKYLLPFIGTTIAAHRMPLRDSLTVGAATNTGFVDADCTNNGIANPTEAAKYLNSLIKPSQLGTGSNGGLGWYERNLGLGSGVEPIGCYDSGAGTNRFVIDLRSSLQRFRWGAASGSQAGPGTTAVNGHYYGQRSSSTLREIYRDGTSLGSDGTSSDAASGASVSNIYVAGSNEFSGPTYWKGRGACAYIAAFHTLLGTYLITPTGR